MNFKELIETVKRACYRTLVLIGYCVVLVISSFAFMVNAHEPSLDQAAAIHVVEIKEFKFVPSDIDVKVGDTIKWINRDFVPHTATAQDKSWDSDFLAGDSSWEMIVSKDLAGNYICTYHPTMKGSIRIVD